MTSLLARVGALESRLASQIRWSSDKRKRRDWICAECRRRKWLRQRRAYSDDAFRITPDHQFFPLGQISNDGEATSVQPPRYDARPNKTQPRQAAAWGLRSAETGQGTRWHVSKTDDTKEMDTREGQEQNPLWEQFERVEEDPAQEAPVQESNSYRAFTLSDPPSLADLDYAVELSPAIVNSDADKVMRCLMAASRKNDLHFIRNLSAATFAECIRILQPSNFPLMLATAYLELTDAMAKQLGIVPARYAAVQLEGLLKEIVAIRRCVGIRLGLPEYKTLLRSSRDLGSKSMARRVWQLLLNDGYTPDTECYNYHMAANVWNGIHEVMGMHKMRVVPFYQLVRRQTRQPSGFTDYRVGDGGIKVQVLNGFREMLRNGAIADEESFRNVITAAAREGDMGTVRSILKRIWDIDVDTLMSDGATYEASLSPPDSQNKDSPLHPTSKLLFTLAHAFGINNDVPTALRLVDFVARRYELAIEDETWIQLFKWTFVLALPRPGRQAREHGSSKGQLPKESVLSLWDTMTSEPYNVKPNMGMYNLLIKNLQHRQSPALIFEKMQEGFQLHEHSRMEATTRWNVFLEAVNWHGLDPNVRSTSDRSSDSLESLWQRFKTADLYRKRNLFWLKRWLRLLTSTNRSFMRTDQEQEWSLREFPRILLQWRKFAAVNMRYEVAGGVVEILMKTDEELWREKEYKVQKRENVERILIKAGITAEKGLPVTR